MPPPKIQCSAQQTRFDPLSVGAVYKRELDLHDVTVTVVSDKTHHQRDILAHARIKLNSGVRYLLHGQNGSGKSTILQALGKRLIPGIPEELRISYLEQREKDSLVEGEGALSALELVVQSDAVRSAAIRKRDALQSAIDNTDDPQAVSLTVKQLKHEAELDALAFAHREAELRSGARGKAARKALIQKEEDVEESLAKLDVVDENKVLHHTDEAVAMLAAVEAELEAMSADTAHLRAENLLLGLGFTRSSMTQPLRSLSGGWRMKAHLASALFVPCHLLLLDEPTSFLDFASLLWLEAHLADSLPEHTTLLLVSHDRTFADAVADECLILRERVLETFAGNLGAYFTERRKKQLYLGRMKEAQEKQIAQIEKSISNSQKAARRSGDDKKLKQAASKQKKLDERMGMQVSAKGGRWKLNRDLGGYHTTMRAEIEVPTDEAIPELKIPKEVGRIRFPGPLVGCEGLSYTYKGTSKPVFSDVNLSFRLGERVAFVGLNGMGKSTLINCLLGSHSAGTPDVESLGKLEGSVTKHPGAIVGYYSQEAVEALPWDITALQYLNLQPEQEARGALAAVGLTGTVVSNVTLGQLSGGQRVRVALAKILFPVTPHVLVLDEITTHLDADTVLVLAEQLRRYEGLLVLVAHDRWFLNAVLGDTEDFSGSSDEDSSESETAQQSGVVYWVDRGKVKKLEGGVDEFEDKVRRRAAKLRKAES